MTHTLELPDVPAELLHKLDERRRETGQERADYVLGLLERDLHAPTLTELLAPFRAQVTASGLSDPELDALFQEARQETAL